MTKTDLLVESMLEELLRALRGGEMAAAKFSFVHEEDRLAVALELADVERATAQPAASQPAVQGRPAGPVFRCPKCGSSQLVEAGGGDVVCLSCQANFSP